MAFDLGSLATATPAGAAASILSSAAQTATSSGATSGPTGLGPKVISIAGFGSKAGGSATQSLTQPEPDSGGFFPSSPSAIAAGFSVPGWVVPAVGVLVLVGVLGVVLKKGSK